MLGDRGSGSIPTDPLTARARARQAVLAFAAAAAVILIFGLACAEAGAAPGWSVDHPPVPRSGHADLGSVSCPSPTTCVAVGIGLRRTSSARSLLSERWNGTHWTIQPIAKPGYGTLNAVSCSSRTACTAVGIHGTKDGEIPLAERWNGRAWKPQRILRGQGSLELDGVSCPTKRFCMAVGSTFQTTLALKWNGSDWASVPTPTLGEDGGFLTGVSCTAPTSCTAVGSNLDGGLDGCTAPLAEQFNGVKWAIEPTPSLGKCGDFDDATLNGVSCTAATVCTAAGFNDPLDLSFDLPLLEPWSAGHWSLVKGPNIRSRIDPWGGGGDLLGISCASPSVCVAVGYLFASGAAVPLVEHHGANGWRAQSPPRRIADGVLFGVSCATDRVCMAVGEDDSDGLGTDVPLAERLS
jgi:hypothetical protein